MNEHTTAAPRRVLAVVQDLMFASRIRAAADPLGVTVHFARSQQALREEAAGASLLLLDLNTRWLQPAEEIRYLKTQPATQQLRIVAFGSHLAVDALTAARDAGADQVLANSALVRVLPTLLRE